MGKYQVKAANQPTPGVVAEAWVKIWQRRIERSQEPAEERKRLLEGLLYQSMKERGGE